MAVFGSRFCVETFKVYDSSGNLVTDGSWAEGDTTGWSAYFSQQVSPSGGQVFQNGVATRRYSYFGTLTPGTYTFDLVLHISKAVFDGFDTYKANTNVIDIVGCSFTVE